MNLPIPVIASLCVVVGSIIGGIIVAFLSFFFGERSKNRDREIAERYKQLDQQANERTRQLDVYKTVYPEKFKRAQLLMEAATSYYSGVSALSAQATEQNEEIAEKKTLLWKSVSDLHQLHRSSEWILGARVAECTAQLIGVASVVLVTKGNAPETISTLVVEKSENLYQQLSQAIREELGIDQLESLLPPTKGKSLLIHK